MLAPTATVIATWSAIVVSGAVDAYTATLTPVAPKTIYLQVGAGTFVGGNYNVGGQPAANTTVNTVSVTVPATSMGSGTPLTMTTDSAATKSLLDGYVFCNLPNELYIGGFYRTAGGNTAAALVVANVPANLTDASGDTIPFSQIRWTSSGNGDGTNPQPFPAATFTAGATQNVGAIASNQWAESCLTFSYLNTKVPHAGTYSGVVTYTMSSP